MKFIGILLIIVGLLGGAMAGMMFGDIGVAALIAGVVGVLSGIGLLLAAKAIKKMEQGRD